MNNLFVLNETFTNGYKIEILYFIFFLSILCGVFVIISKNPIVSVLFLIGLFLSISIYLIMLGMNFIGISYLLVYVGAISILFLFILMLINIRISELISATSNTIPLAVLIAISFYAPVYKILPYNIATYTTYTEKLNILFNDIIVNNQNYDSNIVLFFNNKNEIPFVTSKIWDGNLAESTHISSLGNIFYTNYSIWLIIASLILLLAMVGAIVITIKQK